ncbi:hypothetical protein J6590_068934 [Homalodisca vitripennis]|nr:hypothetical protein J6590_068934 [Homalodisca vitripennis]
MAVTQELPDISCLVDIGAPAEERWRSEGQGVGPDGQDQAYCAFVGQVTRVKWSADNQVPFERQDHQRCYGTDTCNNTYVLI